MRSKQQITEHGKGRPEPARSARWSSSAGGPRSGGFRPARGPEIRLARQAVALRARFPLVLALLAFAAVVRPGGALALNSADPAVTAVPLFAQAAAADTSQVQRDERLRSPRAALMGFLEAVNDVAHGRSERMADAVLRLDLEEVPAPIRATRGPELAVQLKEIIDRTRFVVAEKVPDDPEAASYVFLRRAEGEIVLAPDETGHWRFTRETVASIPDLFAAVQDRSRVEGVTPSPLDLTPGLWVRSQVPEALRTQRFLLEDWQWMGLFALILAGILLDRIVAGIVLANLNRIFRRQSIEIAEKLLHDGLRPVGLLVMALTWWVGLRYLALPARFFAVLLVAAKLIGAVAALWTAFRAADVVAEYMLKRAKRTESKIDDVLIPMFRKAVKVFATAIGIVFIADSLDIDVTAFLAGLGLGGLALALAAKDTLENLFGSVTVLLDRPFQVGDWIKLGNQEGTVTEVGFRSTRIRTFYDSVITIPNAQLINSTLDNMGARRYRRWSTKLGVQYDTPPERIEAFCEGIRELIRCHPHTRKDVFHVYVNEFGGSSLDILLYVFHETPDWKTELRERHRLFLDILRLAQRLGIEFAFPTQTVHLFRGRAGEPDETAPDPVVVEQALEGGRALGRDIARRLHPDVPASGPADSGGPAPTAGP